jgi:hypothetical protein
MEQAFSPPLGGLPPPRSGQRDRNHRMSSGGPMLRPTHQLRQLGDVGGDAPGLVAGEQCKLSFRFRIPFARQLLRLGDLRGGHFERDLIAGRGSTF